MSLFAFLLLLLRFLVPPAPVHAGPVLAPAAVAHTVTPAPVASAPTPSHGRASADGARVRVHTQRPASVVIVPPAPVCPAGSSPWPQSPTGCMVDQLPQETIGRAYG